MSGRGDYRKFVAEAVERGWQELRHSRHLVLVWRSGERLVVPRSPSDQRAIKNLRAEMRRIERRAHSSTSDTSP